MDISKVSSKNQITVPKEVRQFMGIGEGDRLSWILQPNGEVTLKKTDVKTEMLDFFTKMSKEAEKQGLTEDDLLAELDKIREEKKNAQEQ